MSITAFGFTLGCSCISASETALDSITNSLLHFFTNSCMQEALQYNQWVDYDYVLLWVSRKCSHLWPTSLLMNTSGLSRQASSPLGDKGCVDKYVYHIYSKYIYQYIISPDYLQISSAVALSSSFPTRMLAANQVSKRLALSFFAHSTTGTSFEQKFVFGSSALLTWLGKLEIASPLHEFRNTGRCRRGQRTFPPSVLPSQKRFSSYAEGQRETASISSFGSKPPWTVTGA